MGSGAGLLSSCPTPAEPAGGHSDTGGRRVRAASGSPSRSSPVPCSLIKQRVDSLEWLPARHTVTGLSCSTVMLSLLFGCPLHSPAPLRRIAMMSLDKQTVRHPPLLCTATLHEKGKVTSGRRRHTPVKSKGMKHEIFMSVHAAPRTPLHSGVRGIHGSRRNS